jgi:hypothetical protein
VTQTIAIIITAVLAVATALGLAYAVFRSTARTNTTLLYERENDALTKALLRQEAEATRLATKVETLTNTNAVLQETVSGAAAVRTLAVEIQREEAARREEHKAMMMLLKDIIAEIRQARGTIQ